MILSVSRRTDIPAFYSEWFINRIREGIVYVRNPFNYNQISSVPLTSDNVDCIVFWTKNASNIMKYLDELDNRGFKYYFQYTITPYNTDIEPVANKKKDIIENFIEISKRLGKHRVILRYDPILITTKYNEEYHYIAFEKLCRQLSNYTERVVFSFLDDYKKIGKNMKKLDVNDISIDKMRIISEKLVNIANKYNLELETCAEKLDLDDLGIKHSSCIDGKLIEKIIESDISFNKKHKFILDNNREACGCIKCIDIGEYDTCIHGCTYCYANLNKDRAVEKFKNHNKLSPIICGEYKNATVKQRNEKDIKSFKINNENTIIQQSLFD